MALGSNDISILIRGVDEASTVFQTVQANAQQLQSTLASLSSSGGAGDLSGQFDSVTQSVTAASSALQDYVPAEQAAASGSDTLSSSLQSQVDALQQTVQSLQAQIDKLKEHEQASRASSEAGKLLTQTLSGLGVPIGELQQRLGQMGDGLTKMSSSMGEAGAEAGALADGLALVGVGIAGIAAAVVGEATKGFVDLIDRMHELSEMSGLSLQTVQALDYGMQTMGRSGDDAQRALLILQRNAEQLSTQLQAGTVPTGQFVQGLEKIHVSVTAFASMNPEQQLDALLNGLRGVSDEGQRAAIATELFGARTGAAMLALVEQGQTLDQLKAHIEGVGATITSADWEQKLMPFHKATADLNLEWEKFEVDVGSKVLPVVTDLIAKTVQIADAFISAGGAVAQLMEPVVNFIEMVKQKFDDLPGPIKQAFQVAIDVLNPTIGLMDHVGQALGIVSSASQKAADSQSAYNKTIAEYNSLIQPAISGLDKHVQNMQETGSTTSTILESLKAELAALESGPGSGSTALAGRITALTDEIAKLQSQLDNEAEKAALASAKEREHLATVEAFIPLFKQLHDAVQQAGDDWVQYSGDRALGSTSAAIKTLQDDATKANEALKLGSSGAEEYATFQRQVADAVAHANDSLQQQRDRHAQLESEAQSSDTAIKQFAQDQMAIDAAVQTLGPDLAEQVIQLQDLRDTFGITTEKIHDVRDALPDMENAFHQGALSVDEFGQALQNLESKPSQEELQVKAQLDAVKASLAAVDQQLANSSPADQRVAALVKLVQQDEQTGASAKKLEQDQAELAHQLSNPGVDPSIVGLAQYRSQLEGQQTVLAANLTALQSQRTEMGSQTAATQAMRDGTAPTLAQLQGAFADYERGATGSMNNVATTAQTKGKETGDSYSGSLTSSLHDLQTTLAGLPADLAKALTDPASFEGAGNADGAAYRKGLTGQISGAMADVANLVRQNGGAGGTGSAGGVGSGASGGGMAAALAVPGLTDAQKAAIQSGQDPWKIPGLDFTQWAAINKALKGGSSGTSGGAAASTTTGGIPADIVAWANTHAAQLGTDPKTLALMLLSSSDYETGLKDVFEANPSINPGGVQGAGPFQITPYQKAQAAGYDPHTAGGSLDYLLNNDNFQAGVNAVQAALASGMPPEMAMHEWERVTGRPNAQVDANRIARGDWHDAYQTALSLVNGGSAPAGAAPGSTAPAGYPNLAGPGGPNPLPALPTGTADDPEARRAQGQRDLNEAQKAGIELQKQYNDLSKQAGQDAPTITQAELDGLHSTTEALRNKAAASLAETSAANDAYQAAVAAYDGTSAESAKASQDAINNAKDTYDQKKQLSDKDVADFDAARAKETAGMQQFDQHQQQSLAANRQYSEEQVANLNHIADAQQKVNQLVGAGAVTSGPVTSGDAAAHTRDLATALGQVQSQQQGVATLTHNLDLAQQNYTAAVVNGDKAGQTYWSDQVKGAQDALNAGDRGFQQAMSHAQQLQQQHQNDFAAQESQQNALLSVSTNVDDMIYNHRRNTDNQIASLELDLQYTTDGTQRQFLQQKIALYNQGESAYESTLNQAEAATKTQLQAIYADEATANQNIIALKGMLATATSDLERQMLQNSIDANQQELNADNNKTQQILANLQRVSQAMDDSINQQIAALDKKNQAMSAGAGGGAVSAGGSPVGRLIPSINNEGTATGGVQFTGKIVFGDHPDDAEAIADVYAANASALKQLRDDSKTYLDQLKAALEKVGFATDQLSSTIVDQLLDPLAHSGISSEALVFGGQGSSLDAALAGGPTQDAVSAAIGKLQQAGILPTPQDQAKAAAAGTGQATGPQISGGRAGATPADVLQKQADALYQMTQLTSGSAHGVAESNLIAFEELAKRLGYDVKPATDTVANTSPSNLANLVGDAVGAKLGGKAQYISFQIDGKTVAAIVNENSFADVQLRAA